MPSFIRVEVSGDKRVAKAFREMGLRVSDLRDAWARIGAEIRDDAKPLTPVLTGRLVNTLRAGKTKSQAVVRAGGRKVVYAGVQNYGWPGHNIEAKHFLNIALMENADFAEREVENEVMRLARRVGLK